MPANACEQQLTTLLCRLTALHLHCSECAWSALAHLYSEDSRLLADVALLLLDAPEVAPQHRRAAFLAHQHLYLEVGMRGYYHSSSTAGGDSGSVDVNREGGEAHRTPLRGRSGRLQLGLFNPRYAGVQ